MEYKADSIVARLEARPPPPAARSSVELGFEAESELRTKWCPPCATPPEAALFIIMPELKMRRFWFDVVDDGGPWPAAWP